MDGHEPALAPQVSTSRPSVSCCMNADRYKQSMLSRLMALMACWVRGRMGHHARVI